jgi:hypothetical protein
VLVLVGCWRQWSCSGGGGGGGAGDALGRVRCHKYWRAARTAAGQRRAVQNGRVSQGQGTHEQPRRGKGEAGCVRSVFDLRVQSEATGGRWARMLARGCGGVKKGFSKRVEEARRCGSEKEIQRDGRGRGRYYYPPDARLASERAQTQTILAAFTASPSR